MGRTTSLNGPRHGVARRLQPGELMTTQTTPAMWRTLRETDPEIAGAIADELRRQNHGLELIASENFVSRAILEAAGSVFTNKYAEGYPGRRYYGGRDELDRLADQHKPKMIMVGASAYPRVIDFARFRRAADRVGAAVVTDMAHIAGLVAAGVHPSPIPHSDFVSTTTHKTLRGPRAGMVLCREQYAKDLDKSVFPGVQGGPLVHIIAAKAVCFKEAAEPAFAVYQRQIVANATKLAGVLSAAGFRLVSGGTDNHLMLVDVFSRGVTGKLAEAALGKAGITVNKNAIPFDRNPPLVASGIRIGTPAVTTRGMREREMEIIGRLIARVLRSPADAEVQRQTRQSVLDLTDKFPLYPKRLATIGQL